MQYKWLAAEAGRTKGQVEDLDHASPVTAKWVERKWIEPLAPPKPSRSEKPPELDRSIPAPPMDKVMRGRKGSVE